MSLSDDEENSSFFRSRRKLACCSGGSKNLKRRGAEDNLSATSSFIANAHDEIYAFYTEKTRIFDKHMSQ